MEHPPSTPPEDVLQLIERAVHSFEGHVPPAVNAAYHEWMETQHAVRDQVHMAYDMTPKPQPGQLVRVTYESVWARWAAARRPVTKSGLEPDASQFLAPCTAIVEIIKKEHS